MGWRKQQKKRREKNYNGQHALGMRPRAMALYIGLDDRRVVYLMNLQSELLIFSANYSMV